MQSSGILRGQDDAIKIIAFDWHDVIAEKQIIETSVEAAKLWWNNIADTPLMLRSGLGIAFTVLKNTLKKNGKKLSVGMILLEYPELEKYRENLYYFSTLEKPIQGMPELIKKLKEKDVKVVLASNMNEDSLEYSKRTRPELFDLFDAYYVCNEKHGEKPNEKFYHGLRKKMNKRFWIDLAKEILFIDDKKQNVDGAFKADVNIKALHFKNIKQLLSDLVKAGYLEEHDAHGLLSYDNTYKKVRTEV